MKISYTWLQSYFDEKLPEPEKLAERITFSFAEVEGVEKKGDDTVLDIKVLPDRACYALSHRGVAYEVSAILDIPKKKVEYPKPTVSNVRPLVVRVEAPELCLRYSARVVENVTQKEQTWTKEHLEVVGQRAINPVVDGANLVMFDRGQPLHAFDADKVKGGITVRLAVKGEKMTTLDNREVSLDESILIIADEEGPLALAGIKGGKKAEVTSGTKNLILESANFASAYIRKASERLGIKTDASKRFENKFSASLAVISLEDFSAYLFEMDKNAAFGEVLDWYPNPAQPKTIAVETNAILQRLGVSIPDAKLESIFSRLRIEYTKTADGWTLTPPLYRADLSIPEDIAEEVGRLYGLEKIPATLPPMPKEVVEIPKTFSYEWKIREALIAAGFSEVMTSSFSEKGDVIIEKPLAEDKKHARPNLRGNFEKALKMNVLNAPVLGEDTARLFEIGKIFQKDGEKTAIAIGVAGPKKKVAGVLESAVKTLSGALGAEVKGESKDGVFEGTLDTIIEKLPEPTTWNVSLPDAQSTKFKTFSLYPFIVRDVALFVSADTSAESVATVIKESAGELVARGPELFDEFSKDGKKSLAFRTVFQSQDRTLSDEEVNKTMEGVYSALKTKGWEVR